jgi:alkylation response protein AidB-like acyl-CoA dehydrogenase
LLAVLNGGRIGITSQALGIATGSYELALKYSQERKAFGKNFQNTKLLHLN